MCEPAYNKNNLNFDLFFFYKNLIPSKKRIYPTVLMSAGDLYVQQERNVT